MIYFTIPDCAKDGGEEFFTKMHSVLKLNFYKVVKDWQFECYASW